MKIVIPISQSDVSLLDAHTAAIVHLGPLATHEIVLMPTPEVKPQALQAAEKLRAVCSQVTVETMPRDFKGGWPTAANNHWYEAVMHLDRTGNRAPWLWLELDAVPVVEGWASKLQDAYYAGNKPFFGCVKPIVNRPEEDMLMGVAIYPPGIPRDEIIKPLFNNVGYSGPSAIKQPFDLYLRWPLKHRGVFNSPLVADFWRSCDYVRRDGVIHCSPIPGEKLARSGAVPATAVLVHGCKDGSLHRLVVGSNIDTFLDAQSLEDSFSKIMAGDTPVSLKTGDQVRYEVLAALLHKLNDAMSAAQTPFETTKIQQMRHQTVRLYEASHPADGSLHRLVVEPEKKEPWTTENVVIKAGAASPELDEKWTKFSEAGAKKELADPSVTQDVLMVEDIEPTLEQRITAYLDANKVRVKTLAEKFDLTEDRANTLLVSLGYVVAGAGWVRKSTI